MTEIEISPINPIKIKDIGIDYSKFIKERHYRNLPLSYVYHNKNLGMAIIVDKNEINEVYLFPPNKNYSRLCGNNETAKKFYSMTSWFVDSTLKEREIHIDENYPANVTNLVLSANEIIAGCGSLDAAQNKSCSDSVKEIAVATTAQDPENDVVTYSYTVSGGRIVGQGARVFWDLSGLKAGTYTITVGVDDGGGISGKTITKTVVVKECPDCPLN